MQASIVDLRYKMNDILKALNRNESITILYHGKKKGLIVPTTKTPVQHVTDHPFFGMHKTSKKESVPQTMKNLRKGRYHDL